MGIQKIVLKLFKVDRQEQDIRATQNEVTGTKNQTVLGAVVEPKNNKQNKKVLHQN
jgi:hypothetical protein